jgi:hypothetical protein
MNKEFHANLAKAIKTGISKYQDILAKNQAKEKNGLEKLNKTLGGNDPALTGAGGNLSAGSATTEVPNLARAEYKVKKGPGERTFGDGMRVEHSNPSSKGKSPFNFSVYGRSDEAIASSKKKNTRAEYEASKVEKGELGMSTPGCPCGGSAMSMGIHSGQSHTMCSGCGAIGTTPQEENTAAMAGAGNNVAKGEFSKVAPGQVTHMGTTFERGTVPHPIIRAVAEQVKGYNTGLAYQTRQKTAKRDNKIAEHEASKVEKGEPLATVRTTTAKGISGLPAPKSKMVVKAETNPNTKQADMVGTVEAKNVKGAKDGSESVPEAKKTDGSGDVSKGKIEKGEYNGEKTMGDKKYGKKRALGCTCTSSSTCRACLRESAPEGAFQGVKNENQKVEKGAMVDHIKAASNKAGVSAGKVLSHGDPKAGRGGYQVPKTLQTAKPAPTPNFNKGEKDSAPKWEGAGKYKDAAHKEYVKGSAKIVGDKDTKVAKGEMGKLPDGSGFATGTVGKSTIPMTGHANEMAIKTGRPTIPGRPLVTKLTGGVQTQIAAQKKPLIPMVNTGVVAKGEYNGIKPEKKPARGESQYDVKPVSGTNLVSVGNRNPKDIKAAKKNNTRAEYESSKVEKAEPTMAKPVTKSPSSGAAGKAAPTKSTVAPKAPSKL